MNKFFVQMFAVLYVSSLGAVSVWAASPVPPEFRNEIVAQNPVLFDPINSGRILMKTFVLSRLAQLADYHGAHAEEMKSLFSDWKQRTGSSDDGQILLYRELALITLYTESLAAERLSGNVFDPYSSGNKGTGHLPEVQVMHDRVIEEFFYQQLGVQLKPSVVSSVPVDWGPMYMPAILADKSPCRDLMRMPP